MSNPKMMIVYICIAVCKCVNDMLLTLESKCSNVNVFSAVAVCVSVLE